MPHISSRDTPQKLKILQHRAIYKLLSNSNLAELYPKAYPDMDLKHPVLKQ